MLECKTCRAYEKQIEYLQGLVQRLMDRYEPKIDNDEPDKPAEEEEPVEQKREILEQETFGEG